MIDFSIITAVYNTAGFLDEAIQSVVSQTVGIERIQLILVNDASTDHSLEICRRWESLYPDNIKVIDQPQNHGVSASRNTGLRHAVGRYINFLDSDDKFSPDVCEHVEAFFGNPAHCEAEAVALPIFFFDGDTGPHPLNDKFHQGTRVINLDKEWYYAQNFVNSVFFRAGSLSGHEFDQRMPLSEDLKFVQEILLHTHRLGVISETKYLYRRRTSGQESAIQAKDSKREWYVTALQNGLLNLANAAKGHDGSLPRYVQFIIMYDLQWRLKDRDVKCPDMSQAEKAAYYDTIHILLTSIDDEVIEAQKYISADTKALAKLLKRGYPYRRLQWLRTTRLIKLFKPFV